MKTLGIAGIVVFWIALNFNVVAAVQTTQPATTSSVAECGSPYVRFTTADFGPEWKHAILRKGSATIEY